jgi:REP element-mobilizing transposase RayT
MKSSANKPIRLPHFNYDWPNQFFITICAQYRNHLFGDVKQGIMHLSEFGKIAHQCWQEIPQHFPEIDIDEFIIMPDHIHGILIFNPPKNKSAVLGRHACQEPLPQHQKLSVIIGSFKSAVSKRIRSIDPYLHQIWQKSFYDKLIRTDNQLALVRRYIKNNPQNWNK